MLSYSSLSHPRSLAPTQQGLSTLAERHPERVAATPGALQALSSALGRTTVGGIDGAALSLSRCARASPGLARLVADTPGSLAGLAAVAASSSTTAGQREFRRRWHRCCLGLCGGPRGGAAVRHGEPGLFAGDLCSSRGYQWRCKIRGSARPARRQHVAAGAAVPLGAPAAGGAPTATAANTRISRPLSTWLLNPAEKRADRQRGPSSAPLAPDRAHELL